MRKLDNMSRSAAKYRQFALMIKQNTLARASPRIFQPVSTNILILHGPNLNLLGEREPQVYGSTTLDAINEKLVARANAAGVALNVCQSNVEGELVSRVQQARLDGVNFIIVNPAAFTHTSVALRDALSAVRIPFIEVHLSNVYRREEFRRHSYMTDLAVGVISGLGAQGYELALDYALQHSAGG
jgi:3-dehydroquinate dehydratase-2